MNDTPACRHLHTKLIAKDSDAEYVECLDCGAIVETGENSGEVAKKEAGKGPGFDESLSDA
jgi:Zn ribbon nucleic-acid-binding protein